MQPIHRLLTVAALLALAALPAARAQAPRVVLFEDPALGAARLHYPLLISSGRGYRMLCSSQQDEEAVIRGLGFTSVPSEILTAVDTAIVGAEPGANPLLCPSAADYPIKAFAADRPDGVVHYLQFPTAIGATGFTDRLYTPGCVGLVEALQVDLSQALVADPTPFFEGKIHEIACLTGAPPEQVPQTFAAWCTKGDRTPEETATVMAVLDATPQGVAALGDAAACGQAGDFLGGVTTLDLRGKSVQSLAPLAVLRHLTQLLLADNQISDLSPLTDLGALTFLDLSGNQVSNIVALAPLTTLTRLDLSGNRIEDIRFLAALTLLTGLNLDSNAVLQLSPLQFLQALTELSLADNGLTGDMLEPLTGLGALTSLDVSNNRIETFTHLGDFPSTVAIDVTGNPIATAGGSSFLDLCILHQDAPTPFGQTIRAIVETAGGGTCSEVSDAVQASSVLELAGRSLSDIRPVSVLRHLTDLDLSDNQISDVRPLAALGDLLGLDLSSNAITDVRPVGQLGKLTRFAAADNPVALDDFLSACLMREHDDTLTETQATEVAVLLDLSGAPTCQGAHDTLRRRASADASGRGLSTVDYFKVLEEVQAVNLADNQLTDLSPLRALPRLTRLWAHNNQIASMSAVAPLTQLTFLALDNNPLPNLFGIDRLRKLTRVHFSGTQVRSVRPLADLPDLEAAGMRNLNLVFGSFGEYCLVHRLDSIALGANRAFMAAAEGALSAAGVDATDCDAVDQWARTVTALNLNKKSIHGVEPIIFFDQLRELFLYDNLITNATPIAQLRQLKKLNLNKNRLSGSVPRFRSQGLELLNLIDNDVSNIAALSNLTRLKHLYLRNNRVMAPGPIAGLGLLDSPDLRDNRITSLSHAGTVLARNPYLKGNPVCRLRIAGPLAAACTREPPLVAIIHDVGILDRQVIRGNIVHGNIILGNPINNQ